MWDVTPRLKFNVGTGNNSVSQGTEHWTGSLKPWLSCREGMGEAVAPAEPILYTGDVRIWSAVKGSSIFLLSF